MLVCGIHRPQVGVALTDCESSLRNMIQCRVFAKPLPVGWLGSSEEFLIMGHSTSSVFFFCQSIQTRNIPFFASSSYTMNFSNVSRNRFLANAGFSQPQPMSTGTTICGVIFDGGLVLGADTRATAGALISLIVFLSPFHIHTPFLNYFY